MKRRGRSEAETSFSSGRTSIDGGGPDNADRCGVGEGCGLVNVDSGAGRKGLVMPPVEIRDAWLTVTLLEVSWWLLSDLLNTFL